MSKLIDNLIYLRELYLPPRQEGPVEPIDETWLQATYCAAIVSASLIVVNSWLRRPFSSIFSTISGGAATFPLMASSVGLSYAPQGKTEPKEMAESSFWSPDRYETWLMRISRVSIDPAVPHRARIAWAATAAPVIGLMALFSPSSLLWYSNMAAVALLSEAGLNKIGQVGYQVWKTRQEQAA